MNAGPFHEHMPRQALALAGWVLFWIALELLLRGLGLEGRRQLGVFLVILGGIAVVGRLAAPGWLFNLLTSVRFALTQGAFLIAAVLSALAAGPELLRGLWCQALLAVLAVSMLAVTWKRRPYDLARLGFLLVHTAPTLVLLGALWGRFTGVRSRTVLRAGAAVDTFQRIGDQPGRWLIGTGCASFLLGCAWMFYLKPVLKRRQARP